MEVYIAVGRNKLKSRNSANWENVAKDWSWLAKRLGQTTRTPEFYHEYIKLGETKEGKAEQANIKDRGSFVGGYLQDGKRSPKTVAFRQLITLDLDFAKIDFWEDFTFYFDVEAVIHSTHKHSNKTPRYRLIIPLDRKVNKEEYEAIARRIAGDIDINLFDPTTFQPERLMYWPTTSRDGDWFYEHQEGPFLSADRTLKRYHNWKDISEWPKPSIEKDHVKTSLDKQGIPEDKPGLIGAFCRQYGIKEAILEFLQDTYVEADADDRYTYKKGTTEAGAIVYGDNQFLYSHHSTDPICSRLVNAFDLVRIHKFGEEDNGADDVPINKRASYKAMCDYARGLPDVVRQLAYMSLPEEDFAGLEEDDAGAWYKELTVDRFGAYENTMQNFKLILANDPKLKDRLRYDLFNLRDSAIRPLPWDEMNTEVDEQGEHYVKQGVDGFTDKDEAALRLFVEKKYGLYHLTKLADACNVVMRDNAFHPIRDYLQGLRWDGVPRVETLLIDYLGANETPFTREVTRKTLLGAVARVMKPGVKFDWMMTIIGPQGRGKSRLIEKLACQWFSDSFMGVEGKQAFEQLQGVWIMEIGELAGIKKADQDAVKKFISKRKDSYRPAYGKRPETYHRQNIFIGTDNHKTPFTDVTGNRRYWPVEIDGYGLLDIDDLPVNQIWAEALYYYRRGEVLYLSAIFEEEAKRMQEQYTAFDDRAGIIMEFIESKTPKGWDNMNIPERTAYIYGSDDPLRAKPENVRSTVCVGEIYCELMKCELRDMRPFNTKYIHDIMQMLPGWELGKNTLTFPIYGRQRYYKRVDMDIVHINRRSAKRK